LKTHIDHRAAKRSSLGLFFAVALFSSVISAQQFQDQSTARLPDANEYSSQVAVADVDGDGDLDLAFANGRGFATAQTPERVRLLINDGAGTFFDETIIRLGNVTGFGRDVEFGDVDNDGDVDLVVVNDFNQQQRILINSGSGFFSDETASRFNTLLLSSSHCAFGDVDNDGDLDLWFTHGGATSRFGSGRPQLLINDGSGHFANETTIRLPNQLLSEPMDCIFGDLDGDLDLDLVAGNRSSNTSRVYFNDGSGHFVSQLLPPTSNTYSFDLGDLDSDGDLDIIGANSLSGSSREAILINDGAGQFTDQTAAWIPAASNPNVDDNDSKFFDYDGDGDLDVIIASLGSTERLLQNNGGFLSLVSGALTPIPDSSLDVEVGDFDGDGDFDLVTAQGESGGFRNRIYINTTGPTDQIPPSILQQTVLVDTFDASGPYVVRAILRDQMTSDRGAHFSETVIRVSLDGNPPIDLPLRWSGHDLYRGEIPGQVGGTSIAYSLVVTDFAGNVSESNSESFTILIPDPVFRRGDCNQDGMFDLSDAVATLTSLFGQAGPVPCEDACDSNDDGSLDIADPVATLTTLFNAGPLPPAPGSGPDCGEDPTDDGLGCENEPNCP